MENEDRPKSKRGFASMSPEKRSEIARMGGKAVGADKRSFSRDRALAAAAGKKGGLALSPETRSFTRDRELAAKAGRKGGMASKKTET